MGNTDVFFFFLKKKELGWEKVSNWDCLFVHRKQGCEKVRNDNDDEAKRMEDMRTQRECESDVNIIEEYTKMLESRISAGATEILFVWKNLTQKQSLQF